MSELENIVKVFRNATEEMLRHQINQWDEIYPNEDILKTDIENEELLVGKINNEIAVVYVLNQLCDEQYSNGIWKEGEGSFKVVHRLCVNPIYQNRGIAKRTMAHIEEVSTTEDIPIHLFSHRRNSHKCQGKFLFEKGGTICINHINYHQVTK